MKKVFGFIGGAICLVAVALIIYFVGSIQNCMHENEVNKDFDYISIGTIEELYAMESNKAYELIADMDLEGREWYPLTVTAFKGNGHTIKNATITENVIYSDYNKYDSCAFFVDVVRLDNVKFENITVDAKNCYSIAIAVGARYSFSEKSQYISNVEVNNCTINSLDNRAANVLEWDYTKNIGFILGGHTGGVDISNCVVTNSTIDSVSMPSLINNIGGIAGRNVMDTIENCEVINCNFNVTARGKTRNTNVGGIYGNGESSILNSTVINCKFIIESISEDTARAGGVVGYFQKNYYDVEISKCISANNYIEAKTTYGYNIGGFVGRADRKINNCLSDNNILSGSTDSSSNSVFAGVGGFCGAAFATISKSVAQNCQITGTSHTGQSMYACGFMSQVNDVSVSYCAVYNNTISGGKKDAFVPEWDMIYNCYIADIGSSSPNINKLPIISEEWTDIIDLLSLNADIWKLNEDNELTLIIENLGESK